MADWDNEVCSDAMTQVWYFVDGDDRDCEDYEGEVHDNEDCDEAYDELCGRRGDACSGREVGQGCFR